MQTPSPLLLLTAALGLVAAPAEPAGAAPSASAPQVHGSGDRAASSAPVDGAAKLATIRARGRVIISVKNRGPEAADLHRDPAHFQKREYELALARDVTRKIFGDDTRMLLKILPRPQRLPALAGGEVDLVISMLAVPPDTSGEVVYSHPYLVGGLQLMAPTGTLVKQLDQLRGQRVAAVRESVHDPGAELQTLAAARGIAIEVLYFSNFQQANAAIARGEAAALVSMDANVDAFIAANRGFVRVGPLLARRAYAVGVRRGDGDLLALVDGVIDELGRSGELARRAARLGLAYRAEPR